MKTLVMSWLTRKSIDFAIMETIWQEAKLQEDSIMDLLMTELLYDCDIVDSEFKI